VKKPEVEMSLLALGVDSGTQSTKIVAVDIDRGRVVGRGQAPHVSIVGLPAGSSEQDPAVWGEALTTALGETLRNTSLDPGTVVAIGVSGQQHGFVPLDARGRVIRPAKLWNDTSTVEENEAIIRALGGRVNSIETLGLVPAVGFTASKILWLKNHEPGHFARLAAVLLPHNYLNYVLSGEIRMEYGDASGTGLMDIRRRVWREEAAAAVDSELLSKLPVLRSPSESVGYLRRELADRFGLGKVLVAAGGGDNMMGAIGTGNVSPGICTLSLGTSGTIYAYSPEPFIDPCGEIAAFCDSTGGWLPLLCTMNVTNTTELWKKIVQTDNDGRDALAALAPAGAGGTVFLPFIDGERVPVLPESSGVFFGLNRSNFHPAHMTRAVMEGTLLNLGYGFERLRALGTNPSEIRATGGAAQSLFWLRLAADIFQVPVRTLKEPESAAYGAALQAIWNWRNERGEDVPLSALTEALVATSDSVIEPDRRNRDVYAALRTKFDSLWRTLNPEFRNFS
jgi:xylulokinase